MSPHEHLEATFDAVVEKLRIELGRYDNFEFALAQVQEVIALHLPRQLVVGLNVATRELKVNAVVTVAIPPSAIHKSAAPTQSSDFIPGDY